MRPHTRAFAPLSLVFALGLGMSVIAGWPGRARADTGDQHGLSLHARFGVLGVNQKIGDHPTILLGGEGALRYRTRGRFGIEGSIGYLHGKFTQEDEAQTLRRDSLPFVISGLFYLFPAAQTHAFNLYTTTGLGLSYDRLRFDQAAAMSSSQELLEVLFQAGLGVEYRYHWFALQAEVRAIALYRTDALDGASYNGTTPAPIPLWSVGAMGTLGLSVAF